MTNKPKYLVTYNDDKKETVEGHIVFFSKEHPVVPFGKEMVYLNAAAVVSVIPQSKETGKEV